MTRTALDRRQTCHRIAIWLVVAALVVARTGDASGAEAPGAGPKIESARIGFKNHYKLGFWTPVWVEVSGAQATKDFRVDVSVVDSDGVATIASAPLRPPTTSNGRFSAVVYTQVGRIGSPIGISLIDGEQLVAELNLQPKGKAEQAAAVFPIPATSEFVVSLGAASFGLRDAFPDRDYSAVQTGRKLIELQNVADLPTHWFGYEAVDVLLIAIGDGKLCQELANDTVRFAALQKWVELGGRLVILCGGEHAQAILGASGPLATLVPGKLAEVVRLPETGALEHYAASAPRISSTGGAAIQVPRLVDVDGNIEVYAGRKQTDLPLVVRSARGLGEIAFVAVEFSQPPLATWSGRTAFLHSLMHPYLADAAMNDAPARLVTSGYNDLSGALRQQLGRTFPFVAPIGFPLVTGLVIAYLLFLGPLDYLLVHRLLRRPLMAWISFPLIVAAFSILALAVGNRSKGSASPRVNRLALVDFDTISGEARGTFWATLYSPDAKQFDLAVKLPELDDGAADKADMLFSWWGLPGIGIGGMQTGGADLGIIRSSYRYGPERKSLEHVPVLASATKSLLARWTGPAPAKIEAQLADEDGLVIGSITNQTGSPLRNVRLLYGSWAYRLDTLNAGEQIEVGEQLSPRRAKTIVTRDALGESGANTAQVEGRVFAAEQASVKDILNLMMFYETAGGYGFAHLPNRYQTYCDLSRQLELGRAVLVADAVGPGAQLVDNSTGQTIGDDKLDTSAVLFRFVLPVKRPATP